MRKIYKIGTMLGILLLLVMTTFAEPNKENSLISTATNTGVTNQLSPITVISPNGGENWLRGVSHTITWSSAGAPGANVKIELLKNGVPVGTVTSSTPNDGSYPWTISSGRALGTDYKIRVTITSNPTYTDMSDSNFIISDVTTSSYNAVYGKFQESFQDFQGGVAMSMTIDVPVKSNVYLSASGLADSATEPYLQVDNGGIPDWAYGFQQGPFSIARVITLNKGIHTINLHVTGSPPALYGVTMSAVVSEKGSLNCGIYNPNCVVE